MRQQMRQQFVNKSVKENICGTTCVIRYDTWICIYNTYQQTLQYHKETHKDVKEHLRQNYFNLCSAIMLSMILKLNKILYLPLMV